LFSLISRYAHTVSEIIAAHGGSVVAFAGDGQMAAFGAAQPLAHTARSQGGRRGHRGARDLPRRLHARAGAGGEHGVPLSVRVGIATGPAFVGDIQAADRLVSSVMGSTTHLAARLEALHRDIDAAIMIDAVPRARTAEETRERVAPPETAITRYDETQTVYALRRTAVRLEQYAA
jgi:class 3 adenylate cyclase